MDCVNQTVPSGSVICPIADCFAPVFEMNERCLVLLAAADVFCAGV